ncbi:MAG TPA: carbohydrate ABC transporter permease [Propionibacteriaceae bacterium]|jgi:ABC-type glycerol-3-phosphate transport system permease component
MSAVGTPAVSTAPAPVNSEPGLRQRRDPTSMVRTILAALLAAAFSLPVAWILINSFRPNQDILSSLSPLSWSLFVPSRLTFDNYTGLLLEGGFSRALLNSLVVSVFSVLLGLIVSTLAAYALSVFTFPGRNAVFALVVISFLVPFEAIAIPLSQQFTDWGLGNTLIGLILPGIGNGLAIFNLRQHFLSIPPSYREAAMLDGASEPRIVMSVFVPMSGAALMNSALLIFLGQWTAYLWPLLLISENELQVAPIALALTFGERSADYGQNFAGSILLALLPALVLFVLQRFFGRISLSSGEK